jgi:acyl carrier protein
MNVPFAAQGPLTDATAVDAEIRSILARHAKIAPSVEQVESGADLFAAGLDSNSVISVMLAIEESFDIEIPEDRLTRASFSCIQRLTALVLEVVAC